MLGSNLTSTILICKAVAKGMRERKQGKIVNDLMGRDPPGPLGYGQTRPGVPLRSTYGGNEVSSNKAAGVSFSGGSFTPPAGQKKGAKI